MISHYKQARRRRDSDYATRTTFVLLLGAVTLLMTFASLLRQASAAPHALEARQLRLDSETEYDLQVATGDLAVESEQDGPAVVALQRAVKKKTTKKTKKTTTKRVLAALKKKTSSKRVVATTKAGGVLRAFPVTTDGTCGPLVGKQCAAGFCCSGSGYCGTGTAWCGAGCQPLYGICGTLVVTTAKLQTTKPGATTSLKPVTQPPKPVTTTVAPAKITTTLPPVPKPTTWVTTIKPAVATTTKAPAPAAPTTTAAGGNCPVYPISNDGSCGAGVQKACPSPYCCSSTGFCGLGDPWCGAGCQNGFGLCNSGSCSAGPVATTQPGNPPTTITFTTNTQTPQSSVTTKSKTPMTTMTIDPNVVPRFDKQTEVGSYFTQWGVYGRAFKMKKILSMSGANELTFMNYAFGNVYPKNGGYECDIINKLESGAGDGGDAWADFGMGYSTTDAVDGVADTWDQPLAGNFNQLKKLKAKLPNLKAFISLGGWTWSKWFSTAASTDALRKQLVSSCINVYLKGNLPVIDGRGGAGAAAGIFDGIDIDWEYPGGLGQPYNTYSANDKANFNLLLAEFRYQLSVLSMSTGKPYGLTIAAGSGRDKIVSTEPAVYSQYLDWINIMSYDYHGAWVPSGPTNFQSNLYGDPATPDYNQPTTGPVPGANRYYNIKDSVDYLIAQGAPADKLVVGVPFYGRGWTGVSAGPTGTNGVYQTATGAAAGTFEAGIEDYKVLKNAAGTVYLHNATQQSYKYDPVGKTWWSYDVPADIDRKVAFAKSRSLRGVFSWSLDGDTADGELLARCVLMKV